MLLPKRTSRRREKSLKDTEIKRYLQKHLLKIEQFMEQANISYEESMRGASEIRFFNDPPSFCVFHYGSVTQKMVCVQFDEEKQRVTIRKNASCPTSIQVNDSCCVSNQQVIVEYQKEGEMLTMKKGEAIQFYNSILGSREVEAIKLFSSVDEMKRVLESTTKKNRISVQEERIPVHESYRITDGFPSMEKDSLKQKKKKLQ